jgi:23S rRNA pseudouridine2605 synthase
MLARVGHKVLRLKRIALGPLRLGEIKPGAFRKLERSEVEALRRAAAESAREGQTTAGPKGRTGAPKKKTRPAKQSQRSLGMVLAPDSEEFVNFQEPPKDDSRRGALDRGGRGKRSGGARESRGRAFPASPRKKKRPR